MTLLTNHSSLTILVSTLFTNIHTHESNQSIFIDLYYNDLLYYLHTIKNIDILYKDFTNK